VAPDKGDAAAYSRRVLRPLALALGLAAAAMVATGGGDDSALVLEAATAPARLAPLPSGPAEDGPHAFAATRRDGTGRPALFDPCRPVRYAVRRQGEPPGGQALVAAAVEQVARATGLVLVRQADAVGPLPDPETLAEPDDDGRHRPVLLAWSDDAELDDLSGDTVALDAPDLALLSAEPDGQERVLGVLLHELSHLVGLAHVDDPDQLLHRESSAVRLGAGDLRGLRAAGSGPCFQDWPASSAP
jgi:hypothetical protein